MQTCAQGRAGFGFLKLNLVQPLSPHLANDSVVSRNILLLIRGAQKGLRICKGLKMARTRNNTKRQDCGHNWWSIRILTLYSEVWTWKRNTCLCHQVKNGSNVIECQFSEKLESQGDGSLAAERYPRNSTASEYGSINFGKLIPGTPAIPKALQKRSAEFLNIGKRHFHQLRNSVSKTSESITGRIPRGHRHALWLAKRCPNMQVRNIVDVEASGLPPGMIGTQEPKSGYHYGDCASTGTPLITNPLES